MFPKFNPQGYQKRIIFSKLSKFFFIFTVNYILIESASLILYKVEGYKNFAPFLYFAEKQIKSIKDFSNKNFGYIKFDSRLGWSINKNSISLNGLYKSNSDGLRGEKNYSKKVPKNNLRVTTFGDSFTHGDDVRNKETWQSQMESSTKNLEVINFGVGGYGLDQAFLRYMYKGREYKTNFVFIGYMTENIYRNRNRFRPFYFRSTGLPFSKPMFTVHKEKLSLIESYFETASQYQELINNKDSTIKKLGEGDFYYKVGYKKNPIFDLSPTLRLLKITRSYFLKRQGYPYKKNSDVFITTKRIFDEFYYEIKKEKAIPIIVIFPSKDDVKRCQSLRNKKHQILIDYLESKRYKFVDLTDLLCHYEISNIFAGHYTPSGNKIVADFLTSIIEN